MKKLKTGYGSHRLVENDPFYKKEIDFVKTINKELMHNPFLLDSITHINKAEDGKKYLSDREEKIVLSVIQWLGTSVGQSFLSDVNKL